jgi:hypothetical protein
VCSNRPPFRTLLLHQCVRSGVGSCKCNLDARQVGVTILNPPTWLLECTPHGLELVPWVLRGYHVDPRAGCDQLSGHDTSQAAAASVELETCGTTSAACRADPRSEHACGCTQAWCKYFDCLHQSHDDVGNLCGRWERLERKCDTGYRCSVVHSNGSAVSAPLVTYGVCCANYDILWLARFLLRPPQNMFSPPGEGAGVPRVTSVANAIVLRLLRMQRRCSDEDQSGSPTPSSYAQCAWLEGFFAPGSWQSCSALYV